MPGQRKRNQAHRREATRTTDRFAPEAGTWKVLFETQDEPTWTAELHRLRTAPAPSIDWSMTRIDTWCGRLIHPTTYRLSLFIPSGGTGASGTGASGT